MLKRIKFEKWISGSRFLWRLYDVIGKRKSLTETTINISKYIYFFSFDNNRPTCCTIRRFVIAAQANVKVGMLSSHYEKSNEINNTKKWTSEKKKNTENSISMRTPRSRLTIEQIQSLMPSVRTMHTQRRSVEWIEEQVQRMRCRRTSLHSIEDIFNACRMSVFACSYHVAGTILCLIDE